MSRIAIVIPARYGSTRFPGKPLAEIAGKTMLSHVYESAQNAAGDRDDIAIMVATEDKRIADYCAGADIPCVITPKACRTGSDRVLEAIKTFEREPDFVINLQGDAPFTPPEVIDAVIESWESNKELDVVTPVNQLDWDELDQFREQKKTTPFSGTTCIRGEDGKAIWFSKNIIPAIRKEETLRVENEKSPIFRHIGLYGFRTSSLKRFVSFSEGVYEKLEGLEQLRMIENGLSIHTVKVISPHAALFIGIDSPEDIKRAETALSQLQAVF